MEIMNQYKAVWLGNPEIRNIINSIRERHVQIELLDSLITEGNSYSESLQIRKQKMAFQAIALIETTADSASQTVPHSTPVSYSYTDIYLAPAKTAAIRSQEICDYGVILLAVNKACGITEAAIKQLQFTIENYLSCLQEELITEKDSTMYIHTLTNLCHQVEDIFKHQLDICIQSYEESDPDFYQAYQTTKGLIT